LMRAYSITPTLRQVSLKTRAALLPAII